LGTLNTNTILTIFVGITAVAFILQLVLLFFLYKAIDRSSARVENIANRIEERATPVLASAQAILEESQPKIGEITSNLAEASATLRAHVAGVAEATSEIVERARIQAARLDELVHSTFDRVSQTTDFLQNKVILPVRRVQAIVSAVSAGVGFLKRSRSRHQGPQLATADDEEMFI
jgi:methyl-accepting chemotaxis protein